MADRNCGTLLWRMEEELAVVKGGERAAVAEAEAVGGAA